MFSIEKLVQVCNYLLKKNNFQLNYTKMIKLLYLADKESLEISNKSITEDVYVSMNSGPVLSHLYDFIKGTYSNEYDQVRWDSRFEKTGYDIIALSDRIPDDELSDFEREVLDTVYTRFKDYTVRDMIDYVHKNCSEWKNPQGSSVPIQNYDIFKSLKQSDYEINWRIKEQEAFDEEDKIFASLA